MMMKVADTSAITVEELVQALDSGVLQILLIDCRSFMEFNTCHISDAHNIHCPPIVKRRSGGILPIGNIVRCPQTQRRLLEGGFDLVVVYDENVHTSPDRLRETTLDMVLKTLREELKLNSVYHLHGGFPSFYAASPQRCWSSSLSLEPKLPSPSQESCTCLSCGIPRGPKRCSCSVLRENSLRQHQRFKFDQGDPVMVLPWLYVGSAFHACQKGRLRTLGVNALLNVSTTEFPQMDGFSYRNIPIDDNATTDIVTWFPEAIDFIECVRKESGRVLVHCHAGISRSATICLAYLMYHKGFSLNQAYDFLKSRRQVISPNFNFMRQLQEYERDLASHRDLDSDALKSGGLSQTPLKLALSPLTPMGCNQKAGVFLFDTPVLTPLSQPVSPLVSPS